MTYQATAVSFAEFYSSWIFVAGQSVVTSCILLSPLIVILSIVLSASHKWKTLLPFSSFFCECSTILLVISFLGALGFALPHALRTEIATAASFLLLILLPIGAVLSVAQSFVHKENRPIVFVITFIQLSATCVFSLVTEMAISGQWL
jgi:hypothetical protein